MQNRPLGAARRGLHAIAAPATGPDTGRARNCSAIRPCVASAAREGKERSMAVMTGLSGNEMYCLHLKGMRPGDLVIGNSVFSMGVLGGIGAGVNTFLGGEVTQVTGIIHEGRQEAFKRMISEASQRGGIGITGVTSELRHFHGNTEFLSVASCVHAEDGRAESIQFSSSAN